MLDALDFEKVGGLVPTIVCNAEDGTPVMLAYSNRESLAEALEQKAGVYWSRSRRRIWRKGETSGNTQRLIRATFDCDRDTLVFYVEQRGAACHKGKPTCFVGSAPFSWRTLYERLKGRSEGDAPVSYTQELLANPELLKSKLQEEAGELAAATLREEVTWECADLLYFMTVQMLAMGVTITDVMRELERRAR